LRRKTPPTPRPYWRATARIRVGDLVFIPGDVVPQGEPSLEPTLRRLLAQGHLVPSNDAARELAEFWGGSVATKLL
jgi:hypothetical protein